MKYNSYFNIAYVSHLKNVIGKSAGVKTKE